MLTLHTEIKWDKAIGSGQRMRIRHYCRKPGKKAPFGYLLMLPEGSDRAEIRHMFLLNQPFFREYNGIVFGCAVTDRGIQKITAEWVDECFEKYGHYDVNKYFCSLANREEEN